MQIIEQYTPKIYKIAGETTKTSGHGGGDLMEDWRLIDCLRNGLPISMSMTRRRGVALPP